MAETKLGCIMRRGEIYQLDFGTPQGSVQGRVRPGLVIQNDIGNRTSTTTIIAAITSKQKKSYPFHVEVSPSESGLPEDSTILLEQIQTVPKNRLVEKIGEITVAYKMEEVDRALIRSLGVSL